MHACRPAGRPRARARGAHAAGDHPLLLYISAVSAGPTVMQRPGHSTEMATKASCALDGATNAAYKREASQKIITPETPFSGRPSTCLPYHYHREDGHPPCDTDMKDDAGMTTYTIWGGR